MDNHVIEPQTNNKNYKMMLNIFAIILGMGIILGVSYAIFRTRDVADKTNVIQTGDFGLEITNESADGISVTNALPMTFEEGMKTTPYTFTLTNTGDYDVAYKLGLEAFSDSTMPSSAVRYLLIKGDATDTSGLTNENTKLVSQAVEETVTDENNQTKTVYYIETGTIKSQASQNYTLYMWIDYDATTEITGTKFKVRARADGEATKIDENKKEFIEPTEEELTQMQYEDGTNQYIVARGTSQMGIWYSNNMNSTGVKAIAVGDGNGNTYIFLSDDLVIGETPLKGNTWYSAGENPEEYTGDAPFTKEDLTTIYSESYVDYVMSLFE